MSATTKSVPRRALALLLTLVMLLGLMPVMTLTASAAQSFYTQTDAVSPKPVVLENGDFQAINLRDKTQIPTGTFGFCANLGEYVATYSNDPDDWGGDLFDLEREYVWGYIPQAHVPGWAARPVSSADNSQLFADCIEIRTEKDGDSYNTYADMCGALNQELYQVVDVAEGQTIYYAFDVDSGTADITFQFTVGPTDDAGTKPLVTPLVSDVIPAFSGTKHYTGSYTVPENVKKLYFGYANVGGSTSVNDGGGVKKDGVFYYPAGSTPVHDPSVVLDGPIFQGIAGLRLDNCLFQTSSKLVVAKTAQNTNGMTVTTASEGDTIHYVIEVSNIGQTEAGTVTMTDELSDSVEFVPGTVFVKGYTPNAIDYNANTVYSSATHSLTIAALPAVRGTGADGKVNSSYGSYTVEFDVKAKDDAGGTLARNQVGVKYVDAGFEKVEGSSHQAYSNIANVDIEDATFHVFYNANAILTGGVVPNDATTYAVNATPTVLGVGSMVYRGHDFEGWTLQQDGTGTVYGPDDTKELTAMTQDVTLYAKWKEQTVLTVTYEKGTITGHTINGENPKDATKYYANDMVTVMPQGYTVSTTPDGTTYVFDGWKMTNPTGTTYAPGSNFIITANTTLTAQWRALADDQCYVNYDANGGIGSQYDTSNPYRIGATANVLSQGGITREGYAFKGWTLNAAGTDTDTVYSSSGANKTIVLASALLTNKTLTFYAKWEKIPTYSITYDKGLGGGTAPTDAQKYAEGDIATVKGIGGMTAPANTETSYYVFNGWKETTPATNAAFYEGDSLTMPGENVTLTAQWKAIPLGEYPVIYHANAADTSGTVPATDSYVAGKEVTIANGNIGRVGYDLLGWSRDASATAAEYQAGDKFSMPEEQVDLYAVWQAKDVKYTVKYWLQTESGTDAYVKENFTYQTGKDDILNGKTGEYTDQFAPKAFDGYTWHHNNPVKAVIAANGTTVINVYYTKDLVVTYNVTYDVNGGTGTAPVDGNNPYDLNEDVTVLDKTATMAGVNGAVFVGWNTMANGSGTNYNADDVFQIKDDTTLYAQWLTSSKTSEDTTPGTDLLPGDTLTYYVTVNLPQDADSLVITDKIPAGTTYVKDSASATNGTFADGTVTWTLGKTVAGTHRFSFQVTINGDTSETATISNTVNGKLDNTYDFEAKNEHTMGAGYTVTYDGNAVNAKNVPSDGNVYADGSTVTVLDKGSMANGSSHFIGWNTKADGSGTQYAGADTFKITADTTLYAQWMTAEKTAVVPATGLKPGDEITYTIKVEVPEACEEFSIVDQIPTGTTYLSSTAYKGTNGVKTADNAVKWNIGSVDAGEIITVTFKVTVDGDLADTGVENTAQVVIGENTFDTNSVTNTTGKGWKVTYDGNGNTSGVAPVDSSIYPDNGTVTVRSNSNLEKTNYVFAGWNTAKNGTGDHFDGTGTETFHITGDTTLYAQWVKTEKTAKDITSGDGLLPGDTMTFTISAVLPTDATGITITDAVPANTTFVSAANGGTEAGGTVTWTKTAAEWKAMGGKTTFTVRVNADTAAGTDIQNQAKVALANNNPASSLTFDTNKTHDIVDPKTVVADNGYQPGSVLEYTITYVNDNAKAATVTVTDEIPEGTKYKPNSATGNLTDFSDGKLTWTIENVAPGEIGTVSFKVTVDGNTSASINNQAKTQVGENNPKFTNIVSATNDVKTSTVKDGDSGEVKAQPMPGDIITYTVNFVNDSASPAKITITDSIPKNTVYVPGTAKTNSAWTSDQVTINEQDGTITWTFDYVGSKVAGYVTFDVKVDDVAAGTMIKNKAYVNGTMTNETIDIVEPKTVTEPEADIIYTDSTNTITDNVYRPGEELTYTIYYTNDTNDKNAQDDDPTVVITDTVPAGTLFVSASKNGDGTNVTPDKNGILTWTFDNVQHGVAGKVTFTVVVNTNEAVIISNTAQVRVGARDPKVTNETKGGVEGKNSTDITPDNGLLPGDTLSYSVDFVNFENVAANLTISDTLPEHTTYVPGSAKIDGTPVDVTVENGTISLTLSNVEAGKGGKLTFDVTIDADAAIFDELKNSVTVAIGENKQTTNTSIDIVGGKDSDDADEIYTPGQEIEYKIAYSNESLEPQNITVTDKIPANTEFVAGSATTNGAEMATLSPNAEGVLTWNILSVTPGTTGYVTFKVKVMTSALTTIENQATIGDRDPHVTQKVIGTVQPKDSEDVTPENGLRPGDTLHYEIGYANNTNAAANITVTDAIPAHTTFVAGSAKIDGIATELNVADGKLTFVINDVATKTGGIVSFDVTVNEDAKSFDEIRNTATVQVGSNDPTTTNETIDIVDPKQTDDTGEDTASIYQPGQVLTYSIKYANDSIIPQNVTINDIIPTGTSYVADSASEGATVSGNTITWEFTNVAAGTVGTVSFKVMIDSNASTIINNKATISIGDRKPVTETTNTTTGTVEAKSSEIENPTTGLKPGDTILYTINYVNSGDTTATIIIKDSIPANTVYVDATGNVTGETQLTWTIDNVEAGAGGSVSFTVRVNEDAAAGTAIKNKASVQIGDNDPTQTNETVDIVEAKTSDVVDGKYQVGDEITYTVAFANDYFQNASVTVTDVIPSGTEYKADSGKITIGGADTAINPVNGKFSYTTEMSPGATGVLTFTVTAISGGTLNNTALVEVGGHDPHYTNTVTARADAKVSEIKGDQAHDGLQVGDTLVYTVNYTNSKDTAQTIVITDSIPANTTFVSGSAKLNGVANAELKPQGGRLTWTVENVTAGESGSVSFEVTVNASAANGTEITNTASVKIGNDDPATTNKTVDIVNGKTVDDADGIYTPGQILTYTIKYGNSSAEKAIVTITDIVPTGTEFVSGSAKVNGAVVDGMAPNSSGLLTWIVDNVEPGTTGSVSFQVKVTTAVLDTQINNQAQINNNPTNTVTGKVETKTSSAPLTGTTVGSQITYTVTYRNATATEQTVKITDAIPENTTYVQNSASNSGTLVDNVVTWSELKIAGGESITVSFKVTVNSGVADGSEIRNQASIIPSNPTITPVKTNETIDIVNPKTVDDKGTLSTGKELTYTIKFANDQTTAQNIVISDAVPAGTQFVAGSAKMTVDGAEADMSALAPNADGKLVWNADNVGAGKTGTVSFTVKVTASSGSVSNTGSIQIGDDPAFSTNTVTNKFPGGGGGGDNTTRYTLTFVTNGGSAVSPITRDKGTVIQLTQTTTRSDYTFEGWYLDKELTKKASSVTLNSDMTVYAKWTKNGDGTIDWNRTDHFAYIIGYNDGLVHPEANITRGETATIFFRLMTDASRDSYWKTTNSFSDVSSAVWFNNAVSTMANANFIEGYDDGTFGGNKPITRAEFATIAVRANGGDGVYAGTNKFSDISGHWAEGYINEAAEMGLIEGYSNGTFNPNAYITRAEAMTLVNRFLGRDKVDSTSLISGMVTWPDNQNNTMWYYYQVQEATNSHDFTRQADNTEAWTKITAVRDWAALERNWSAANSAK